MWITDQSEKCKINVHECHKMTKHNQKMGKKITNRCLLPPGGAWFEFMF